MALMKKHLAYFTSRSFPLGSAPVCPGFFPSWFFPIWDFGSHKGTLRTALQRYSLDPRGRYPERKFPDLPPPVTFR
jgi:hypothetical protein